MSQKVIEIRRYKFLLVFASLVICGLMLCYALGNMGLNKLRDASEDFAGYKMLKKGKGDFSFSDSLKMLEKASEKSEQLMRAVPKDGRASFLMSRILEGAKANGLNLGDIQTMEEISHGHYVEIPISLTTSGKFMDIEKYLMYLENMDLSIKLRNLNMESLEINKPEINLVLELSAFVFDG